MEEIAPPIVVVKIDVERRLVGDVQAKPVAGVLVDMEICYFHPDDQALKQYPFAGAGNFHCGIDIGEMANEGCKVRANDPSRQFAISFAIACGRLGRDQVAHLIAQNNQMQV
ncbi:MAG: hypothetical protein IPG34_08570 [Rhodocyclaceae bacterium]|nr:hypothetical protein [Rhodocyclaceae bacterium]